MIREKNVATAIILTILTCGIYGIVWFITMTDDVGVASKDSSVSGGMAFLLTIVTCGIYKFYWNYQMGKKLCEAKDKAGLNATDNSVLYLILSIFQLDIVNYCLIQSELNELARV